ncbi:MAG: sugar ABC transporter ATP-binding protein [Clostridia bacterium]
MEKELLLKTNGIGKTYGTNTVLQNIDIQINRGEIVGLIGENGAGKSTLLKIIAGVEKASAGTMEMNGVPFHASSMMDANRHGIGMVFQEQSLISNLTVAQNIYLGREKDFARAKIINWGKMNARAKEVLAGMGLEQISPKTKVRDISFSMRQMVEITKVLDIISETANNRALILLDEPTTVLSDAEIKMLFDQMQKMKERGNSIIFISHRLTEVLEVTDRIYVFKDGNLTAQVDTGEADEFVLYEKMVGRETNGEYYVAARQSVPTDEVVMEVKNLGTFGAFKDVSFQLNKGEVLGLCGVEGSGKEAVCAVLCGDEAKTAGQIFVKGKEHTFSSPNAARQAGILSVPRDRREEGIIGILSISENISVTNYQKNAKCRVISNRKQDRNAREWVENVGIKCSGIEQRVNNLSGGNAQKVIFARVLDSECPILILDHPTRGVDVGSKGDIYRLIRDITEKGVSVILMGDTLDECIGLASRIIVMKDGLVRAEFNCPVDDKPDQVDVVKVML